MKIEISKEWDGNECVHEARNGRVYVSTGRMQWVVLVDGEPESAYGLKREAVARIAVLKERIREGHPRAV